MAFLVRLEDEGGCILDEIEDPRGHLGLVHFLAAALDLSYFQMLDPYGDHELSQRDSGQLAYEIKALNSQLTPELLAAAKNDTHERWTSYGVMDGAQTRGYKEYLSLASLDYMKNILSRVIVLAKKAARDPELRLMLYGD